MLNTTSFKNHRFSQELTKQLDSLSNSDNFHALLGLGLDFGIIVICIWITNFCYYFYPLAIFVIGARQRGLASVMHDAAHSRAAKAVWLNVVIGRWLSAYLIFQLFSSYKQSHVQRHHAYLGDALKDPDFQFYQEVGLYKLKSRQSFFHEHVLSTLLMINVPQYLIYLFKNRLGSLIQYKKDAIGLFVMWGGILSVAYSFDAISLILLFWLIPYFTAFMVIGRFIEIAEHYPLLGNQERILSTRNRFSHPVEAFFLSIHHENFHLVHHLRPGIPYWNMKKAHAIMLQDEQYRQVNKGFGGVFFSSNNVMPLIPSLIFGDIALPSPSPMLTVHQCDGREAA